MPVQMELKRIIISDHQEQQIIVLQEVDGERSFPIVIGIFAYSVVVYPPWASHSYGFSAWSALEPHH